VAQALQALLLWQFFHVHRHVDHLPSVRGRSPAPDVYSPSGEK
jgi:hypothetical protein